MFWYPWSPYCEKKFCPSYSAWPKKSWPMIKRSLGQKFFFAIFCTFGRYVTHLRGTFVENVKKSPKSTHPTVQHPHCRSLKRQKSPFGPLIATYIRLRINGQAHEYSTHQEKYDRQRQIHLTNNLYQSEYRNKLPFPDPARTLSRLQSNYLFRFPPMY
jgi:hypothetical protein